MTHLRTDASPLQPDDRIRYRGQVWYVLPREGGDGVRDRDGYCWIAPVAASVADDGTLPECVLAHESELERCR